VEKSGKLLILFGDRAGRLTVFENSTRVGSIQVATDPIVGLRGAAHAVFWWTASRVGQVSPVQMDELLPPCAGWTAPVVDVASDGSRVYISLADGDVLVYQMQRGKVRQCDLLYKFPLLGPKTDQMLKLKGFLFRLADSHLSILSIRHAEFADGPVLWEFIPNFAKSIAIHQGRLYALTEAGISIFTIDLKQAPDPVADDGWSIFDYIPKFGLVAVVVVMAVLLNIRKINERKNSEDADLMDSAQETTQEQMRELETKLRQMREGLSDYGLDVGEERG